MTLEKTNTNYYYNLGRVVAVVEIINNLQQGFASRVHNNALEKLPAQLTAALKKSQHNIHKELVGPADIVLNHGQLPSKAMTATDSFGRYWIGYYHEKSYLADTYKGVFGKEEVVIEHHQPERVDVREVDDNSLAELKR